jgi:hypothetical protein
LKEFGMHTISERRRAGVIGAAIAGMIGLSSCGSDDGTTSTPHGEGREDFPTHVMHADYPYYSRASDMSASSTTVVTGRILESRVEIIDVSSPSVSDNEEVNAQAGEQIGEPVSADMVFTVYTLEIDDIVKREVEGQLTRNTIEVKVPGGKAADAEFVLDGAPELAVDLKEEFVFFLEEYEGDMPASPLNSDQAVLRFDGATGQVQALEGAEVSADFLRDVRELVTDE